MDADANILKSQSYARHKQNLVNGMDNSSMTNTQYSQMHIHLMDADANILKSQGYARHKKNLTNGMDNSSM